MEPINLYTWIHISMMEPMAQENGLVAVVKEVVEEENLIARSTYYMERYRQVHLCARGTAVHKKHKLKPSQVLIKAWDRRPEKEVM